jgi:hypothetical protein
VFGSRQAFRPFGWAGDGAIPPELRLQEDRNALRYINASGIYGSFQDAIYRRTEEGQWLIQAGSAPRSLACPPEAGLRAQLCISISEVVASVNPALVLTCAAVGDHVDHVHIRDCTLRVAGAMGRTVSVWEDLPYSLTSGLMPSLPSSTRAWGGTRPSVALAEVQMPAIGRTLPGSISKGRMLAYGSVDLEAHETDGSASASSTLSMSTLRGQECSECLKGSGLAPLEDIAGNLRPPRLVLPGQMCPDDGQDLAGRKPIPWGPDEP